MSLCGWQQSQVVSVRVAKVLPKQCLNSHWASEICPRPNVVSAPYRGGGFSPTKGRAPNQGCPSPKHSHGNLIFTKENSKLTEKGTSMLGNTF